MSDTLRLVGAVELLAAAEGKPRRLSIVAYRGGEMNVAGFGPVAIELSGMTLPPSLPILSDHENAVESVVGTGTPTVKGTDLIVAGVVAPGSAGERVVELLTAGHALQASIGAEPGQRRYLRPTEKAKVNGRELTAGPSGLLIVEKSTLREITITPVGADSGTSVTIAAKKGTETMPDPIIDPETIRRQERERLQRIDTITGGLTTDATIKTARQRCIDGEATIEELQSTCLSVLRASRTAVPFGAGPRTSVGADDSEVLSAALCRSHGLSIDKAFPEQVCEAASAPQLRGFSLHGLMRHIIVRAGGHAPSGRFGDSDIRAAFESSRMLTASMGPSTYSLPGILSNVANKALLASYEETPVTFTNFCRRADAVDFKPMKNYRMIGSGQFELIPPGGEIKHISLSEEEFTNQIDSYGALVGLDRRDFINDDLGSLMTLPRTLGRLAAIRIEKAVYELLLANAGSFFSSGNNNASSGGNSALASLGLGLAYRLFQEQIDANGDPVLITPRVLLVPPSLEIGARRLAGSTVFIGGTSESPELNAFAGLFEVTVGQFLAESAALTGADNLSWYLLAGASDFSVIETAFLNGQSTPIIEQGELDFNRLGAAWRAYSDFGVALLDHRGGVLNVGH